MSWIYHMKVIIQIPDKSVLIQMPNKDVHQLNNEPVFGRLLYQVTKILNAKHLTTGFLSSIWICTRLIRYFEVYCTVGARIPNKFGIRMVHSPSVLVPTIRKQNILDIQNGRSKLGRFIYSGGSKTKLGKPNTIPIPNVLMFWFRMVRFSNGLSETKSSDFEWWLA